MNNQKIAPGEKVMSGTIDCTPTWESLVPWFLCVLEEADHKPDSKKIIRDQIKRMAQVADMHVARIKKEEVTSDNLMEKIIEIAKPKFCGDTSCIINAKAKLIGYQGAEAHLNGLVGRTANPFPSDKPVTGMVGLNLFPGQRHKFPQDRLNVKAEHILFIE